jgi:hypothetical protein
VVVEEVVHNKEVIHLQEVLVELGEEVLVLVVDLLNWSYWKVNTGGGGGGLVLEVVQEVLEVQE